MSRLLADLVIALGIVELPRRRVAEIREPEPEDPPRQLNEHGMPIFAIAEDDPRLPDLMRRMNAARLPQEVLHITDTQADDPIRRFDASNNPVDVLPALPPLPGWTQALQAFEPAAKGADRAMAQLAKVWPQPQRKPPPCAGHSRLGRPFRVGGESRRPGTADAEKRAKRKAAEKSRRRNRR